MFLSNDSFPYASYKLRSARWTPYNLLLERLVSHSCSGIRNNKSNSSFEEYVNA